MKARTELTNEEIESIINRCEVCYIGMVDGENGPYVLPFNFGYANGKLYIHSGPEGKKIDIWRDDPRVCVSFSTDYQMRIQNKSVACSYSMRYRSVQIFGRVIPIEPLEEKESILNIIMEKYSDESDFTYSKPALVNVKVFEVEIGRIEGRIYGY